MKGDRGQQYVARQQDCQRCPIGAECLPPGQMRRYVALSVFHSLHLAAEERNEGEAFKTEMLRRKTIAEGCSRRGPAWAGQGAGCEGCGRRTAKATYRRWRMI